MRKSIQLRGISHLPSDRLNEDGGCTESLNVSLEQTEVAPMLAPVRATSELVGQAALSNTAKYIYVHKTNLVEIYVTLTSGVFGAWISGSLSDWSLTLASGESYVGIASVGNTLMISTSTCIHYVYYNGTTYINLGTKIPEPKVSFKALGNQTNGVSSWTLTNSQIKSDYGKDGAKLIETIGAGTSLEVGDTSYAGNAFYNAVCAQYQSDIDVVVGTYTLSTKNIVDKMSAMFWAEYVKTRSTNLSNGLFSSPVFVRYAVRLYDGSYIYQSVPYLLHEGKILGSNNTFAAEHRRVAQHTGDMQFAVNNVYKATATIDYTNIGNWSDIVRSVEMFISTDIHNPAVEAKISGSVDARYQQFQEMGHCFTFRGQTAVDDIKDVKDEILSKTNFYLIESKDIADLTSAAVTMDINPVEQDELVVRTRLDDDALSHHSYRPIAGISAYNSRLMLMGLETTFSTGYGYLQSTRFSVKPTSPTVFDNDYLFFKYYIKTDNGDFCSVIGKTVSGSSLFTYATEGSYYGLPVGFLYYPDPRCYKVDIYYGTASAPVRAFTVPMKEHPGLNGSYALCSLSQPVSSIGTEFTPGAAYPTDENRIYKEPNKLVLSDVYNPFVLPLTNRQTLGGEIVTVGKITRALSTAQYGQFDIYAFCSDGIWSIPVLETGSMGSAKYLSADVILSAKGMTHIDQAIVFQTKRGVHLLTESNIKLISPDMNGPHYIIASEVATLLNTSSWSALTSVIQDATPFLTFMASAECLYDYAGQRLIFFNSAKTYQYVYALATQTWHKMSVTEQSITYAGLINCFPRSIAVMNSGSTVQLYDFANVYDASLTQPTLKGVILTRAMDFGVPFVQKSIRDVRLRGTIETPAVGAASKVKYLPLGSDDGITYGILKSLKGKSYKFYRFLILMNADADEKLSYLEIEYEQRRNNRMR